MAHPALPVVAIIGRPNVGKSALFNRILQRRQALVDATPGLTRDRLYGDVRWRDFSFRIVDTGGLTLDKGDKIAEAIRGQVARAMEESSAALLLCDARAGLLPLDRQVAEWARRWGKPILVAANKVDSSDQLSSVYEFSSLGLGDPFGISGLHGLGVGDLLDALVERLRSGAKPAPPDSGRAAGEEAAAGDVVRVAIVGRPNVGKSSFVNRVLNEERVLVDETPGTTRDPVDTYFNYRGKTFRLIDTAGMRAKRRLKTKMDAVARLKALDVVRGSDVCLGLLEGPLGIVQDDLRIFDEAVTAGKPVVLAVNKWDLVKGSPDPERTAAAIARRAPFLRAAPVICISAKTGLNVLEVLDKIEEIVLRARRRMTGGEGRRVLEIVQGNPKAPPAVRRAALIRLSQADVSPPTFHLLLRLRGTGPRAQSGFQRTDLAYLEGTIRRELKLEGIPLRLRLLTVGSREKRGRA